MRFGRPLERSPGANPYLHSMVFEDRNDCSHKSESAALARFRDPDIEARFVPWCLNGFFGLESMPESISSSHYQRVAQCFARFLYDKRTS